MQADSLLNRAAASGAGTGWAIEPTRRPNEAPQGGMCKRSWAHAVMGSAGLATLPLAVPTQLTKALLQLLISAFSGLLQVSSILVEC